PAVPIPEQPRPPEPRPEARPPEPPKPEAKPLEFKPAPKPPEPPKAEVKKPEPPALKPAPKPPEPPKPPPAKAPEPPKAMAARPGGPAGKEEAAPHDAYGAAAERWRQRSGGGLGGNDGGSGPIGSGGEGKGGGGQLVGLGFIAYRQQVINTIKARWTNVIARPGLVAGVRFEIAPDGQVSNVRLAQGSGNPAYDASAMRAVQHVGQLPPPPARYASEFHEFVIEFHSEESGGQGAGPGAQALVKGGVTTSGDTVTVEVRLLDVPGRHDVAQASRRYSGPRADLPRMVHRTADVILEYLTGERGPFDSAIALVSTRGGRLKDVFRVT